MRSLKLVFILTMMCSTLAFGQLKPGEKAPEFSLKNVDNHLVSLSDFNQQKGIILIFTSNSCPFAKAYEDRIIKLHKNLSSAGFPVVAINPNDESMSPDDSFEGMQAKAKEKGYSFPYLKDAEGEIYKAYQASRTPQVFLLKNEGDRFTIAFTGSIDDNAMDEKAVSNQYVIQAVSAIANGIDPNPAVVKTIGCTIKANK